MDRQATDQTGDVPLVHRAEPRPSALNVRYGRAALAVTAILGVLGMVLTLALAAFGTVSAGWPAILAVLAVSAIALLRTLAVRDRRRRVNRAFAEAMWPEPSRHAGHDTLIPSPPRETPRVGLKRETALFDAEQPSPVAAEAPVREAAAGAEQIGPGHTGSGESSSAGLPVGPPDTDRSGDRLEEDPTQNDTPGAMHATGTLFSYRSIGGLLSE
ncbi:hypothetical protein [Arthrobacter sp. Br18]|uniref:hypothetical protein n=1 Tax=Arthrobacter sp. Br18 TaxID=1312954 RepID=UPI0004ACCAF4|nr:hypothetical protein [Arthrobacter sp. Br18]